MNIDKLRNILNEISNCGTRLDSLEEELKEILGNNYPLTAREITCFLENKECSVNEIIAELFFIDNDE